MMREAERQCVAYRGTLNLWPDRVCSMDMRGKYRVNLTDLQISDSFSGYPKVLWIRYVCAGNGERRNKKLRGDGSGAVQVEEVMLDVEGPHMVITKEEFVSCLFR